MKNMKQPTIKQFSLNRLKLEKGGGVELGFTLDNVIGAEHFYDKQNVVSHKIPHPDLTSKLTALKPIMLNVVGRTENIETMNLFTVTGVNISGDLSKGVIITGTYLCKNDTKIAVVTPRVKLDDHVWGSEEELTAALEEIATEAYEYIFSNKQAQLSMEFGDTE